MQSGQQGSQQHGGQHASGGTPALDDLGSRQGESAKEASQAWSQDSGKQGHGKR
jgi:Ca-activated chloride channel family protein